jgi:hypothetical protein
VGRTKSSHWLEVLKVSTIFQIPHSEKTTYQDLTLANVSDLSERGGLKALYLDGFLQCPSRI